MARNSLYVLYNQNAGRECSGTQSRSLIQSSRFISMREKSSLYAYTVGRGHEREPWDLLWFGGGVVWSDRQNGEMTSLDFCPRQHRTATTSPPINQLYASLCCYFTTSICITYILA